MAKREKNDRETRGKAAIGRLLAFSVLAAIDIAILLVLDARFQDEKRALIPEQSQYKELLNILSPIERQLAFLLHNCDRNINQYLEKAAEYLKGNASTLLEGDHPWRKIVLWDQNRKSIFQEERPEKDTQFNRWLNCFISRSYRASADWPELHLTAEYATPDDWIGVERLVRRYWIYALLILAASWNVYRWLARRFIPYPRRLAGRDGRKSYGAKSRTISLPYLSFIALLTIDISFLAMLDSLFYGNKRALILDQPAFQDLLKDLNPIYSELDLLRTKYPKPNPRYVEEAKKSLEKNASALLDKDRPWYEIRLFDEDQKSVLILQRLDKIKQFNTWRNCLFSRSFHAPVGQTKFNLTVYYTTPKDWPVIERLVFRYWIYSLLFVYVSWIVYRWLSRRVIMPLRHVGGAMESMIQTGRVFLISKPSRDIEMVFNLLARNQRQALLGLEIDRIVDSLHSLSDDMQVLELFLASLIPAIRRVYPFERLETYYYLAGEKRFQPLSRDGSENAGFFPEIDRESIAFDGGQGVILLCVGERTVGAIGFFLNSALKIGAEEMLLMAQEVQKQAENGLARAFTRSQALTEERNRFGINLATNMGHDLTNIIASGKWDLDTIQRAQKLGIVSMDSDKGSFFLEAVDGLKNNLDFLQKMVDIYRSFGYTRYPRFEQTDVSALTEELTKLFRLSSSQKLRIEASCAPGICAVAEPRLLRMALFNLLANAAQAIQRENRLSPGEIEVRLLQDERRWIVLSVLDNGPGIRNEEGVLLEEREINRIFQSGYSTKKNSGGGLGLAWVKSIMEEFHRGEIRAFNRPEGGAGIRLSFPPDGNPVSQNERVSSK
ncbi:MAG: HAMP domain-containing sensor histidine kinase [Candidatus Omnitrophota bacterium]